MSIKKLKRVGWIVAGGALLVGVTACGGAQPEAQDPQLRDEPSSKGAVSSKKVEQGLDAIREENFQKAEKLLSEATVETPEDAKAFYYYGVALEGVGKPAQAEVGYRRALTLDAQLTEASQNLSALLLDAERPADALGVADQGLKGAPEDAGLLANRALSLDAMGSPDAIAAYEKALSKKPDEPWLRYNYAAVLAINGRGPDAKKELARVPVDDPQLAAGVAQLYGQLKDFPACVSTLDRAIAANKTTELLLHRGVCKHSSGDDAAAGVDLQEAVKTDPSSAPAHYYLGKHLAQLGKKTEAAVHLKKAAELGQGTAIGDKAAQEAAELSAPPAAKKK